MAPTEQRGSTHAGEWAETYDHALLKMEVGMEVGGRFGGSLLWPLRSDSPYRLAPTMLHWHRSGSRCYPEAGTERDAHLGEEVTPVH